uniref:TNFR-Cys domain-containing protein n=1 Tax=Esox lucius TaxID=8010 RepID=A0A3P8Z8M6_ESOLU
SLLLFRLLALAISHLLFISYHFLSYTRKQTGVYTLPYRPDTGELCTNGTTEYYCKNVHMCCSLCSPGTRRKVECSSTSDTVCEPCHAGQYIANFNYTPNCFRCPKCSEDKGLQYVQRCTSSTKAICECKSGMYCILGKSPDCMECASYSYCKPGEGVSTKDLSPIENIWHVMK